MRVLVHIPTRERGFDWLAGWLNNAIMPTTTFLLTVDSDDLQELPEYVTKQPEVMVVYGETRNKVHAYNRDIHLASDWDLLIGASDDMRPKMKGYDSFLVEHMLEHFSDGDGCLWLPTEKSRDQKRNRARMIPGTPAYLKEWICMLPIMGRKYYDRFGYVYHPDYTGFYCDNEQTRVAQALNRLHFINEPNCIKHYHPDWHEEGVRDDLYARYNMPIFNRDRALYFRRKAQGFPKN